MHGAARKIKGLYRIALLEGQLRGASDPCILDVRSPAKVLLFLRLRRTLLLLFLSLRAFRIVSTDLVGLGFLRVNYGNGCERKNTANFQQWKYLFQRET